MNWKQSLDRYLTTPFDDGFDSFAEMVIDKFSDEFYEANQEWIDSTDGQFNKWLEKLFYWHKPDMASQIIERAFKFYKLQ